MAKKIDLREIAAKLKANWDKPNEGEFLSIKEFAFFGLGGMGIYTLTDAVGVLGFAGTSTVVGMILGISIRDAYVIGIIGTVIGYLLMPLNALITDNLGVLPKKMMRTIHVTSLALLAACAVLWAIPPTGLDNIVRDFPKHLALKIACTVLGVYLSIYTLKIFAKKYGKFKLQMVLFGLPALAFATLLVFLPYKEMRYPAKLLLVHLITNLIGTFSGPYGGNVERMQALLTPNPKERIRVYSIAPLALGLMRSIFGMVFPVLANLTGGQLNIVSYRWIIPAFGALGLVQGLLVTKAKERVIQAAEHKPKVDILKAARSVFANKYLWIRNISNLFGGVAGMFQGSLGWILIFGGNRMEWITGIMLNLSYITTAPGNLTAPFFDKRFSKRQSTLMLKSVVLLFQFGYLGIIFVRNDSAKIVIFMIFSLISSYFNSIHGPINASTLPDIWDYQQWKSGERMEASTDLFGYLTTPLAMVIGFLGPFLMKTVGLVSDWDVMYDDGIRNRVIMLHIVASLFGTVLQTLPFLFYDLTPARHRKIIEDLQQRAEAEREGVSVP
ncbi:MAG: hypothetical protein LBB75_09415 [Oscillospiraceae bacterium]|jgi:Na+/melibiose symporter-like transporter|nr:hypothetical protein [Oscillospiraceae bacterium]